MALSSKEASEESRNIHSALFLLICIFFFLIKVVGKESACNAGDARDTGLIPGSGSSPEGGNNNPLQYSCLKSSMERGAWQATVLGVKKSQTWLKGLSRHICIDDLECCANLCCIQQCDSVIYMYMYMYIHTFYIYTLCLNSFPLRFITSYCV